MYYEHKKHSGDLPVVGVNTFLADDEDAEPQQVELMRGSEEEKQHQIANLRAWQRRNADQAEAALDRLQAVARDRGNVFEELMETVKVCSLGQITHALFEVGGQYRRNM